MGEEERLIQELDNLRKEHRSLDAVISGLSDSKGGFDQLRLQRLKKRKLIIKDMILRLEGMLHPDIIA